MTGYVVIINAVFTSWCSKIHITVILLVKEAAYSAIMEVCCEILFISVILIFMGVVIE